MIDECIYWQPALPVFQNKVYPSPELAKAAMVGDVELVQCSKSGLVTNTAFDRYLLTYDQDYQNEQACSPSFIAHLEQVLKIVLRYASEHQVGIEIGCGKGYFLEMLLGAGADITGYDPAYEGTNPRIVKKYFGAENVVPMPDFIILRHVLEHIQSPWRFIEQLIPHCNPKTKIYIEVPCLEWIVRNNAFYDVFYEHVNYFTLDVLKNAFTAVIDSGKLFGDQYIFLIAELGSFREPTIYAGAQFTKLGLESYMESLLSRRSAISNKLYIWGAGAKGITFSNILSRKGISVTGLIDINPAKQGKYAGLSGLPIISPVEALPHLRGSDVYVMNPVYLNEIKATSGDAEINWILVTST